MPTPTFWTAEDKIPISQKKVSIQAENGLSYNLGQQIDFVIPASTGYMMPSETYLRMDVKIDAVGLDPTRLMLDAETGVNVLIRDIRVSSGGAQNILLEELQNVNVLTALKYDYETNDTLKKKRALTEGTIISSNAAQRNTTGCTESAVTNLSQNPYCDNTTNFTMGGATSSFNTVKALLQLPTGIFQNDKIFPLQLVEGLRIQIILEDPNRVFRTLDSVNGRRNQIACPLFHSINGSNSAPNTWGAAGSGGCYLQRNNSITSVANCPFVIGETVSFMNTKTGEDAATACAPVLTDITFDTAAGGATAPTGLIKLTFALTANTSGYTFDSDWSVYSRSVLDSAAFSPTCSVDNVELIVQQVTMPQGYTNKMTSMLKAGGAMNYDFLSFTNYKYSQTLTETVSNIRLPISNSRCKAILAIPIDATSYTAREAISSTNTYNYDQIDADCGAGMQNNSARSGLVGIADAASNYQFIYDGKLNPSRRVPLQRISVVGSSAPLNQQCLIEQEKALHQSGIDPLSFAAYKKNFFIGRALSLQNGVYDARGRDFSLQVESNEGDGPKKNKLWNCWVSHLRRIVVRGDSIALEV